MMRAKTLSKICHQLPELAGKFAIYMSAVSNIVLF